MADTKKYLDFVGLSHYNEKIKAYIGSYVKENGSDVTDKLIALIGAAEKGADEATILARVAALESAVGDVSELGAEVANLVKAILGEASRAQNAESALQDAINALDEKLYGSDSEQNGELVHTKGDVDKIQDRLTALEEDTTDADAITALDGRLDVLEGTGEGSVKKAAADATAAAVAQLISDSEQSPISERFDTLKEIADWILNDESAAQGLNAAARLTSLESYVGVPASGDGQAATGLHKAIADEKTRAMAAEKTNADAIAEIKNEKVSGSIANRVKTIENNLAGADVFVAITNAEIDTLFA